MTTAMARCDYCHADVPADAVFAPYRGATRCKEVGTCERRQIRLYDPTIPPDDDRPVPPPADARPGARCDLCGSSVDLYHRSVEFRCRDRVACEQRQLLPDMAPVTEDFAEVGLPQLPGMFAAQAAARPEVGADPVPLGPAEIAALASRDAAWRKR